MKIGKKIDSKKIIEKLKRLSRFPAWLAVHAFLTFMMLFVLAVGIGGLVFYQYNVLAEKTESRVEEQPSQFKEEVYKEVLDEWTDREKRFSETDTQTYPDPFNLSSTATSVSPTPTP